MYRKLGIKAETERALALIISWLKPNKKHGFAIFEKGH